jgi:hypothetical protein
MNIHQISKTAILFVVSTIVFASARAAIAQETTPTATTSLWDLAQENRQVHRFSTLITAHDVRDRLSSAEGLSKAVAWCRATGVTKVYIEEFRDGYRAERAALLRAKQRFAAAGFEVSGCVTTTESATRPRAGGPSPAIRTRRRRKSSSGYSNMPPGCSMKS